MPTAVIQSGHTGNVFALAIDPQGRFAASAGDDHTVRLWDLASGLQLRLTRTDLTVVSIAFDATGERLFYAYHDSDEIEVWRVADWTHLETFQIRREPGPGHRFKARINELSVDRRHDKLVVGLSGDRVVLLELGNLERRGSYKVSRSDVGGHAKAILDRSGRHLLVQSDTRSVEVYSLPAGEWIRTVGEHDEALLCFTLTHAGDHLITGGRDDRAKVWDLKTGALVRSLEHGISQRLQDVMSVAVTPDDTRLLTLGRDGRLRTWDLSSGGLLHTEVAHTAPGTRIAIDPNGRYFATSGMDGAVHIADLVTGEQLGGGTGEGRRLTSLAVSSDGSFFATGGIRGSAWLWSLEHGGMLRVLEGSQSPIASLDIDPAGRLVALGRGDGSIELWHAASGRLLRKLQAKGETVWALRFSPDGARIAAGHSKGHIHVWDVATGNRLSGFEAHKRAVTTLGFEPGQGLLLSGGADGRLKAWEPASGRLVREYDPQPDGPSFPPMMVSRHGRMWPANSRHRGGVTAIAIGPSGRFFVSASLDSSAKVWELDSGQLLRTLYWADYVADIELDQSGQKLYAASAGGEVKVWDHAKEEMISALSDPTAGPRKELDPGKAAVVQEGRILGPGIWAMARFRSIELTPDGRLLIAAGNDGSVMVWNIETGERVTLLADGWRWTAVSPDGYFDASRDGVDLVPLVSGTTPLGADQFAVHLNRPDLLLRRIGLGKPDVLELFCERHVARIKRYGSTASWPGLAGRGPRVTLEGVEREGKTALVGFTCEDPDARLKHYRIYVDNVLVPGDDTQPGGQRFEHEVTVELAHGRNKIEVSCTNEHGIESSRAVSVVEVREPGQGSLYFLGFGVSDYRDDDLDINYAAKDVSDLGQTLSAMRGYYPNVFVRTYLDRQATAGNVRNAKAFLAGSSVDDTVILLVSGHGIHDDDPARTYYFCTHETDLDNLAGTAASFDAVEDLLDGIPARRKLFLLDTCESGEEDLERLAGAWPVAQGDSLRGRITRGSASRSLERSPAHELLTDKNRFILSNLDRRTGAVVFSSSRAGEVAFEDTRLENGLFTHAILEALTTTRADRDNDGTISLSELRSFVVESVIRSSGDLQHPVVDRDNPACRLFFPTPTLVGDASRPKTVRGIRLTGAGTVTGTKMGVVPAPGTSRGTSTGFDWDSLRLVESTTDVRAEVGTKFGVFYTVEGTPPDRQVEIVVRLHHPPITNPSTGRTTSVESWPSKPTIGKRHYDGWFVEADWELVEGAWRFELLHQGRILASESFTVSRKQ